jgi:DNA-directed RNA polymerase I subunit RPA43
MYTSRPELTSSMQVTNQMLSLTGSLLDDPSNPPPPPEIQSIRAGPSPSPTPSLPELEVDEPPRPAKKSKVKPSAPTQAPYTQQMNGSSQAPVVASSEPQIDERFLSARELKKKHKEDAKKKRDERKSRKEEKQIDELENAGAGMVVGMNGNEEVGLKRKAGDADGEGKKRKKT